MLKVNVVVPCTDRKNRKRVKAVAPELHLRHYSGGTLVERQERWVAALQGSRSPRLGVRDLYKGDHWQIACSMVDEPPAGVSPTVWVSSAGYGLVPFDAEIHPYSATFAERHEDSVITGDEDISRRDALRVWWSGLAETWHHFVDDDTPRSVADIARRDPEIPLLVVGSRAYIEALSDDLCDALGYLSDPELLSVFARQVDHLVFLSPHLIPYDGRLQSRNPGEDDAEFRGAYPSLNIRAAQKALRTAKSTALRTSELRSYFEELMERQPDYRSYDHRRRMREDEVAEYIRQALLADPTVTYSRLIKRFRVQDNMSFEYKRFRNVFWRVQQQLAESDLGPLFSVG